MRLPVVVINRSMMRYWEGRDHGSRLSTDSGQTEHRGGIAGDVKAVQARPRVRRAGSMCRCDDGAGTRGPDPRTHQRDPGSAARDHREAVRHRPAHADHESAPSGGDPGRNTRDAPTDPAVAAHALRGLALLVTTGLAGVSGRRCRSARRSSACAWPRGQTHSVLGMVVKQGLRLVVIGLSLGVALSPHLHPESLGATSSPARPIRRAGRGSASPSCRGRLARLGRRFELRPWTPSSPADGVTGAPPDSRRCVPAGREGLLGRQSLPELLREFAVGARSLQSRGCAQAGPSSLEDEAESSPAGRRFMAGRMSFQR